MQTDSPPPVDPESADDPHHADAMRREVILARVLSERVRVTWALVVSNVVLFVVAFVYGFRLTDGFGLSATYYAPVQMVFYTGMKVNSEIAAGEWWRLPASMWVHLDILHLVFNVYGLCVLGPILEKFYGARRFFFLYLASGIAAAAASYLFNDMDAGGASGAIYGLVGTLGVFALKHRQNLPDRVTRAFTTGMLPWVALSIGIGFLDALPFDNAAHLGGLFAGAGIAALLGSRLHPRTRRIGSIGLWFTTAVGVAILAATTWLWAVEAMSCLSSKAAFVQCYPQIEQHVAPR